LYDRSISVCVISLEMYRFC